MGLPKFKSCNYLKPVIIPEEVLSAAEAKKFEGEVDHWKSILQPGGKQVDQHGLQEHTGGGVSKVAGNLTQCLEEEQTNSSVFQS